jgi:hypothetical protein
MSGHGVSENFLPAPLVPADVDLRDFTFMPLDVVRLRDSKISAMVSGDEFRAAVLLWCASWHQKPASSLADDDVELAQLAGYGRVVGEWQKVRSGALHGWIKCNDGRLYHPVVAEKAIEAWNGRLDHAWRRECDRIRKENKRRAGLSPPEPPLEVPPKPLRISVEASIGSRPQLSGKPDGSDGISSSSGGTLGPSVGIPAENALKGEGEGEGQGQGKEEGALPLLSAEMNGKAGPGTAAQPSPKRKRSTKTATNNLAELDAFNPTPEQLTRLRPKAPRVAAKLCVLAEQFKSDPWWRTQFESGKYADAAQCFANFVMREEGRAVDRGAPLPKNPAGRPRPVNGDGYDE